MSLPLAPDAIERELKGLPGWRHEANALAREFRFRTFRDAMAFMLRASYEAEAMNHHPEWTNAYDRVSVRLNTHDAGGKVTARDVDLARKLQALSP